MTIGSIDMTGKFFVDTNVFVYAVEAAEDERVARARHLIELLARGDALFSAQVVAEFMSTAIRKPLIPLSIEVAKAHAEQLVLVFRMVPLDATVVREALRACERYRLDYYDAQIWAAARVGGCDVILTEDTHGDQIEGVRYVNPFAEGFDLAKLSGG